MNTILRFALARLREPSSLAGLGILAALFGLPPGTVEVASQVAGAALAVLAIVKPESTPAPAPAPAPAVVATADTGQADPY